MGDELKKLTERVERLEKAIFPSHTIPYTVNNPTPPTFYPTPFWHLGPYKAEYTVSG